MQVTPEWHWAPLYAMPLYSADERAKFRFTALQGLYPSQHRAREQAGHCCRCCSAPRKPDGKSVLPKALYRLARLTLAVTNLKLEQDKGEQQQQKKKPRKQKTKKQQYKLPPPEELSLPAKRYPRQAWGQQMKPRLKP